MKRLGVIIVAIALGCATARGPVGLKEAEQRSPKDFLMKAVVGPQDDGSYVVATTQRIAPAGKSVQFPGRPVDMALSPTGLILAAKNMDSILFIDLVTHAVVQTLKFPSSGSSFCGLAWWSSGADLFVTGAEDKLFRATRGVDGAFSWSDTIPLPGPEGKGESASGGLYVDEAKGLVFVAMSRNNSLGVVSLAKRSVETEIPVGMAPYSVVVHGNKAYVSNWGGKRPTTSDTTGPSSGSRVIVDAKTGVASSGTISVVDIDARKVVSEIEVGLHPCGMALSPDYSRLYVVNANSDTVSVVDTRRNVVVQTWSAKPLDCLPFGSAPNALLVSPDGETLYVALGGNNAVAVLNTKNGKVKGLIPTAWYPGALTLDRENNTLCIANVKGIGAQNPAAGMSKKREMYGDKAHGHNSHDHMGSITFVAVPNDETLREYTTQVAVNMRLPLMESLIDLEPVAKRIVPVPTRPGEASPIKYVMYIIKENRTYDQVLGDMPQGDGDPTLCLFGRDVTPNQHALAEQFVLLDNFYCSGVLSADGHQWATESFVTDYLEKSFGDFTRSYPYEGEDALAFSPGGFIWDGVLRKGLTFRDYGEFVTAALEPKKPTWSDVYADYVNGTRNVRIRATTRLHTLQPYICPGFIGFPGVMQDVYRAQVFLEEFKQFEAQGTMPNFIIMLLPNNHTSGTRPGMPTPRAMVADNDLALGRIVDAVSHSRFWPETAIFVVEDDPQAGLDHVDGRRTVAQCISPYTQRGAVDSTHYTQPSMIRTMELILGLPPMNQFDLAANPMTSCFTNTPNLTPFTALPNIIPLDEMNKNVASLNGKQRYFALRSLELPLDDIDKADEEVFNRVIWHSVKGYNTRYPKLARAQIIEEENEDEN